MLRISCVLVMDVFASEAKVEAERDVAKGWRREILLVAALVTVPNGRFRIDTRVRRPYVEIASRDDE
jgi:hypothetical protein